MKGAREAKGEGARQSQQKGGSRASEAGPLFPRLHVNETEKAGPRAPPRNKMALYELFTIPSHRFVPSIGLNRQAATSYSQQYVSSEYRQPYVSYYMPSNANVGAHSHTHPSIGASSGGAVVDEDESQRVPGSQSTEKPGPCNLASQSMATSRTNSSSRNLSEKKTEHNDFCVPTLSSHKVQSKVSSKSVCRLSAVNGHKLHSGSTGVGLTSVVGAPMLSTVDRSKELSITYKTGFECSISENQICAEVKNPDAREKAVISVTDKQRPGQGGQASAGIVSEQLSEEQSTISPGYSCQQSVSSNMGQLPLPEPVGQGGSSIVHNKPYVGILSQHVRTGESTSNAKDDLDKVKAISSDSGSLPSKGSVLLIEDQDNSREDQETSHSRKDSLDFIEGKVCSPTLEENTGAEEGDLSTEKLHHTARDNCDSSGESENFSNSDAAVSEAAQDCGGNDNVSDESDSSILDTVSAPPIAPKDVIRTVGQQQFWRARRAILRQQRIFSDQVFELHKLIKVQQLFAETPNILVGEEIHFGKTSVTPDCDAAACQGDTTHQENDVDRGVQNPVPSLKEVADNQSFGAAAQPQPTSCYPSWSTVVNNHSNGQICLGPQPSVPVAWGYPSLGMGHWMGPMAAHAGTCFFQPFGGGFPPGSVLGGVYGTPILGPGACIGPPPVVSFGSSNCDQRLEVQSELNSRHELTPAASHQWPSATCQKSALGSIPADFPESWYAMQPNHTSYNQRSMVVVGEDTVSGWAASITKQPELLDHITKMPCVPGMPFHWGLNGQTAKMDVKGSSRSECEAEEHSESADAGSNASALPFTAAVAARQRSGNGPQQEHCWARSLDLAGAYRYTDIDNCDDDATYVGDKEAGNKSARWSKRQKEAGMEFASVGSLDEEMGVADSPNRSVNALTLFPLVPSLNPTDNGSLKPAGGTDESQGRVIKVVPRAAIAASESAAGILLSIQQERQQ